MGLSSRGYHDADSHLQVASEIRPFVMCTATCLSRVLFIHQLLAAAATCRQGPLLSHSSCIFLLKQTISLCVPKKLRSCEKIGHEAWLAVHVSNAAARGRQV